MVYSWSAIQGGDLYNFEIMYKESVEYLYAFNVKRTGDYHLAEDITASAFEILWKERQRFVIDDNECLKLLYGISKNLIRDGVRKTKRDIKTYSSIVLVEDNDFTEKICNDDENTKKVKTIESKVKNLSDKDQTTYTMAFVENKTYNEISTTLRVPLGTVKSRISSIKNKLRLI